MEFLKQLIFRFQQHNSNARHTVFHSHIILSKNEWAQRSSANKLAIIYTLPSVQGVSCQQRAENIILYRKPRTARAAAHGLYFVRIIYLIVFAQVTNTYVSLSFIYLCCRHTGCPYIILYVRAESVNRCCKKSSGRTHIENFPLNSTSKHLGV